MMRWTQQLTTLRDLLANLFATRAEAELLLDEAGIPRQRVAFRETAEELWHSVLTEVDRQRRLPDLIRVAQLRYPDMPALSGTAPGGQLTFDAEPSGVTTAVDFAVVAAMPEELAPLLEHLGGPGGWQQVARDGIIRHRTQWECDGQPMTVLASHTRAYGGDATAAELGRLRHYRPRVAAMVGICAGRVGGEVGLGDVLVAERAFNPDEGKSTADGFRPDTTTYMPPAWLTQQLRHHAASPAEWWHGMHHPHPGGGRRKPTAHMVPFASGAAILAVDEPFGKAAGQLRKVAGYDLEVKSFLACAYEFDTPALAVKGVCDEAMPTKNDDYHGFAAEAAARWLHSFVTATARHWPAPMSR